MAEIYEYSQYNEFNRFANIDGIEAKIVTHLLYSSSKYAETFWKILKYNTRDALSRDNLTFEEKTKMVEGSAPDSAGGQTDGTRLFISPFTDDAWVQQCSSVYIFVDDIYPIDHTRANVSLTVETVTHSKINVLYGDADFVSNPQTNPNDYYYTDDENPTVLYKSRDTVLLKCILAELNGLFIDGVGYVQFNTNRLIDGEKVEGKARLSLFSGRSFFGHSIQFNVGISGISENDDLKF